MKPIRFLILVIPALLLVAGEKKPAPRPPRTQAPLTLPAGAKKVKPFTWRYTDASGKVWTYRRTPFGLVRYPAKQEQKVTGTQENSPVGSPIRAFDEGDEVRFEHRGPLGISTWRRKKTELTPEERRAWERVQRRNPAHQKKDK